MKKQNRSNGIVNVIYQRIWEIARKKEICNVRAGAVYIRIFNEDIEMIFNFEVNCHKKSEEKVRETKFLISERCKLIKHLDKKSLSDDEQELGFYSQRFSDGIFIQVGYVDHKLENESIQNYKIAEKIFSFLTKRPLY